jgi:cold shock protein
MMGKIKKFEEDRGFGFIAADDGEGDVFLHVTQCPGGRALERGTAVQFSVQYDDRGRRRAVDVSVR